MTARKRDRRRHCEIDEGLAECEHCHRWMGYDDSLGRVLPTGRRCTAVNRRGWQYVPVQRAVSALAIELMT